MARVVGVGGVQQRALVEEEDRRGEDGLVGVGVGVRVRVRVRCKA